MPTPLSTGGTMTDFTTGTSHIDIASYQAATRALINGGKVRAVVADGFLLTTRDVARCRL